MKGWYCTNLSAKSRCGYEHCSDCLLGVSKEVIDAQRKEVEGYDTEPSIGTSSIIIGGTTDGRW